CLQCMKSYVEFEVAEGAYDISCPDAQCPSQGVLQQDEIKRLAGNELLEKHLKYRLNREVEIDKSRMWCPRAGCETVCNLCPSKRCQPQSVHCPTCTVNFCSNCKLEWHAGLTCEEYNKQLAKQGRGEEAGIPFDSDLIKCCPMCNVPIEKDEGCAQMMCKRCKHVFCWYCLASLDDDFLLRHYDKGPCKNKLGHSRASVIWHRTQVIGIFAGFGILLLVASPLLLLAAPCIVCCKCRFCNAGTTKLDNEEELPGEGS
ncbi:PREDICTED: probable E3 ubiquitin-protein ligase RNF144A-A, partial [Nicrophorus vespilloides]|uniref:RBR-type E3 ubiquitin transferase n=1 Tax=Nicrophorus vespilloides TaxID=110193 RepID=A0ABM1M9A9_NICVS